MGYTCLRENVSELILLVPNKFQWQAVVNTVMNFWVHWKDCSFLAELLLTSQTGSALEFMINEIPERNCVIKVMKSDADLLTVIT
jgi:hypothetical protein